MSDKSLEHMLIELAEDTSWDAFEAYGDGHLRLQNTEICPYGYDFYLRVGLHMNRPMQALMSEGCFVRFRKEDRWDPKNWQLKKLDPSKPHETLYLYPYSYSNPYQWGATNIPTTVGGYITTVGTVASYPQGILQSGQPVVKEQGWRPDTGFNEYTQQIQHQYQQAQMVQAQQMYQTTYQGTVAGTATNPWVQTGGWQTGGLQLLGQQTAPTWQTVTTTSAGIQSLPYDSTSWTGGGSKSWVGALIQKWRGV